MSAAVIGAGSGAWITLGLFAVLVVIAFAGCWFGSPPDVRREILRDLRRERAMRQWKREQRDTRRPL